MVLNVMSEKRNGESMQRSYSRGFLPYWGSMRLDIGTWFTVLLLLFQLLGQTIVIGGFPAEDTISKVAARAAMAAAMGSDAGGESPHHHHRGNMMRASESEDGEEEVPVKMESSLPRLEAVQLLLHKAAAAAAAKAAAEEEDEIEREEQQEEALEERRIGSGRGRALYSEDFQRRASELCRTSATLKCGKIILTLAEGQDKISISERCDLRDDFLKCIDKERNHCGLADTLILPELPPKEMIKAERKKLYDVLWTAGGCILSN